MRIFVDAHVLDDSHQGTRTYIRGLYRELITIMPNTSFFLGTYNYQTLLNEIGEHPNVHFVQLKQKKNFKAPVGDSSNNKKV